MECGRTSPPYRWAAVCFPPGHSRNNPSKPPNGRPIAESQRDMYFPSVAKSIGRVTMDSTGSKPSAGSQAAGRYEKAQCTLGFMDPAILLPLSQHVLPISARLFAAAIPTVPALLK